MRILFFLAAAYLLYLMLERIVLDRSLGRIPLRITVTGTRGKSGVTRILASILKEDGRRVVAKTTGSEARILLPDGTDAPVARRGAPSILEQMRLVAKAARLRADCLVAEIMSLRPENHRVESGRILKPQIVAVTNVRRDHIDEMGGTEGEIARVLALDVPSGSAAFIPERECRPEFLEEACRGGGEVVKVPPGASASVVELDPDLEKRDFPENLDLVCALARHLGIGDETIARGIRKARHDIGRLRVWTVRTGPHTVYLVNAFAANDPESTSRVFSRIREILPSVPVDVVGILNLRRDRETRTVQWLEALGREALCRFSRLYVLGAAGGVVKRRLPAASVLKGMTPEEMTKKFTAGIASDTVVFGFGNIMGQGRLLAEHWAAIGEDYGI